jgi:hypothetical protein
MRKMPNILAEYRSKLTYLTCAAPIHVALSVDTATPTMPSANAGDRQTIVPFVVTRPETTDSLNRQKTGGWRSERVMIEM